MIVETVRSNQLPEFAWDGLEAYLNRDYVLSKLMEFHKIPIKQKKNAIKQASQLCWALKLSKEYYNASIGLSLATKPTLLYYSIMHLALVEILYFHDGNSSIDKARNQHSHHGLIFRHSEELSPCKKLSIMRAEPMEVKNKRKGTFELWRQIATENNLAAERTDKLSYGQTTHNEIFAYGEKLKNIPQSGVSLLDCFKVLPGMKNSLNRYGLNHDFSISAIKLDSKGKERTFSIIIQDYNFCNFEMIYSKLRFASFPDKIMEIGNNGLQVLFNESSSHTVLKTLPNGMNIGIDKLCFFPQQHPLNEFGTYYLGLFICGNYSRYYPDFWMEDIEVSRPIAILINQFTKICIEKMALLTLGRLESIDFVLVQ